MIDGSRYTTDDLDKLPPELDAAKIATEEVGDMLVFFGGQSPFSNFHKSKFMMNGVTYDCNQRFYVHSKAVFEEDINAMNAVMSVDTPQNIKRISDALNSKINVDGFYGQQSNERRSKCEVLSEYTPQRLPRENWQKGHCRCKSQGHTLELWVVSEEQNQYS